MANLIQPSIALDDNLVALASLAERITYLDAHPVIALDLATVPASALPHLADQFHIRHTVAWRRAELDAVRRGLIKDAVRRHRIKGTLAGFDLAASDAECSVVSAITPPAKAFASPSLTKAERNAFVARYPQLRIYRHRTAGQRVGLHCGDTLGRWSAVQSDALLRMLPRAYLWRDGVETELAVIERATKTTTATAEAVTVTEVAIPGAAGRMSFAGLFPRFLTVTAAAKRFYRMALTETYLDSFDTLRRVAADPGLTPIDVRPDAIAQTGTAQGVHAGQFVARHLMPSTARDRLYQRLFLFDPDIDVARRTATLHLNAGRLGMPAHHAELAVRIPGKVSRLAASRYLRGYLVATAKTLLTDCLDAMRDMARASDRIALNTTIKRPASAGESVLAGSLIAGDWIN